MFADVDEHPVEIPTLSIGEHGIYDSLESALNSRLGVAIVRMNEEDQEGFSAELGTIIRQGQSPVRRWDPPHTDGALGVGVEECTDITTVFMQFPAKKGGNWEFYQGATVHYLLAQWTQLSRFTASEVNRNDAKFYPSGERVRMELGRTRSLLTGWTSDMDWVLAYALKKSRITHSGSRGDCAVFDNYAIGHGVSSFKGPRRARVNQVSWTSDSKIPGFERGFTPYDAQHRTQT